MVVDIKTLYEEAEAEAMAKPAKGEKAEFIRTTVRNIAKESGKTRLLQAGLFKALVKIAPDMDFNRSYVTSRIADVWETEKDAEGRVWILINKPVVKPAKPETPIKA